MDSVELILVDDGLCDGTLAIMEELASSDDLSFHVRRISPSRNFGKEAAFFAGIEAARGGWIVTMDDDMQGPVPPPAHVD